MKTLVIVFLLMSLPPFAHAKDLSGTWVSCDPKAPWAYALLSVDLEGENYRWTAEWGSPYAASGAASLKNGVMVLRGCRSYRGETWLGCDRKSPPVFTQLRKQDFERVRKTLTDADLRQARWVRVGGDGNAWEALAGECEKIVARKHALKERKKANEP